MKTLRMLLCTLLAFSFGIHAQNNDPVIMTINGNPITKSEFEYIYNKNNTSNSIDKKSLEEYMDLFVNFKLKVEEAKAQGLDTTRAFKREYNSYRSQLAKPYLIDKDAEEAIIQEAYNRMKEDVEVSHILVRLPQGATAADTLEAWNKIKNIEKRLKKEDFGKVARETSEDPSAVENNGYLGWISAFHLIYPIESKAYETPVGKISDPVKSQAGYHILKVHDRRNTRGEILASHIMVFTSNEDEQQNIQAKQLIDSLYEVVQRGEDFGRIASEFSEDKGSAMRNGELPWFGTGRMVAEFENAAFDLKNVGDISEPVKTSFGWHIIKLLDKRDIVPYEEAREDIERKIKRDERANYGQERFVAQLKNEYNLNIENKNVEEFTALLEGNQLSDSAFLATVMPLNKPLFNFADRYYSQTDFAQYLKNNSYSSKRIPYEIIDEKLNAYITQELLAYEDMQLDKKYDDFRFLSQEYYDGILLFEISNQEVWDKASKDTLGLTNYFNNNKNKYTWDKPHYKGHVVYAKDKATLKNAKNIIKKAPVHLYEKELVMNLNDSINYVKVERGLFVPGDNSFIDQDVFKVKNAYTPSEEYPHVFKTGKLLGTEPEEYSDVRGLVTADYQNYLEEEWIKELRNKYPVVIDGDVMRIVTQY